MPIIEISDLTRRFNGFTAVDHLSMAVEQGEIFGLLGPNGAGKTTVIKMLTTLLPPTSGEAKVAGYSIIHQSANVRRAIGYVPQMLSADGTLTGYENLWIFAKLYDVPGREQKARIHDALSFMGLEDSADRLVRTYSGGMIRRLEIGQSILHHPKVLFLDEPTIGLDPLARKTVWEHIMKLKDLYGTTIFMTTHLMDEADSLCQRIAIMHHGKLVASGTPAQLKAAIQDKAEGEVTLEDAFFHFTGDILDTEVAFVTPQEHDERPGDLADSIYPKRNPISGLIGFFQKTLVITSVEVRKLRHDPTELVLRAVQPALWLIIFGEVFAGIRAIPTGDVPYLDFLAPGILAQSALFVAIFSGMTIIWERDLGIVHKYLVSPTSRDALALGKSLGGGVRALSQAVFIYILAILLGVNLNWNPLAVLGVLAAVLLAATVFCAFSLIIAFLVKTRERFMGIGQVLTMPFFFASNAIYPISIMPGWLQGIARANPLSYEVDALRDLMLAKGSSANGLAMDFGVLLIVAAVLVFIAARLYPRAAT